MGSVVHLRLPLGEFIPMLHEEVQLSTEHLHFLVGVLILLAGLGMIFVPPLVEDHLLN